MYPRASFRGHLRLSDETPLLIDHCMQNTNAFIYSGSHELLNQDNYLCGPLDSRGNTLRVTNVYIHVNVNVHAYITIPTSVSMPMLVSISQIFTLMPVSMTTSMFCLDPHILFSRCSHSGFRQRYTQKCCCIRMERALGP